MDIRGYEYQTNEGYLDYEFYSEGPKGKIKKVVRFSLQNADGRTYMNLGFGDCNENENQFDDRAISNNQDKDKVLATVAQIVLGFTAYFPDLRIYVQGSTPARTRLYQMGIAANWDKIEPVLLIYGYFNNEWSPFQKNINYQAFMALRK
jgi:hypothetical protein